MTIQASYFEAIYTGKDGALTAYQLGKFGTSGKFSLVKVGKMSENGISLQVCDIASNSCSSKVSKGAAEKGTKPVEFKAGDVVSFAINAMTKKDGKDSDEKKIIETVIELFKGKDVKEGEIILLQADFLSIPPSGLPKKIVKAMIPDNDLFDEDKIANTFAVVKFENIEELTEILEEHGYNLEYWLKAYEVLDAAVFREMGSGYQKKDFATLLDERLTAIEAITPDTNGRIIRAIGLNESSVDIKQSALSALACKWLETI